MRLLVLSAVTLLSGSLYAADPELLSLAMPNSQLMAGMNVESVRLSPLGQYLLNEPGVLPGGDLQKLADATGFDFRRDLREILVSSTAQRTGNPGIVLARGAFDVPKITASATADGGKVETYKGVPVIQKGPDFSIAFVDSTLAIGGSNTEVLAAIERKSAPAAIDSALAVQVNQVSSAEDIWFVSMVPLTQLLSQPAGSAANPVAALYAKILQASGGVKLGANLVLTLQAVSETDQDASALAGVLKALPGMAQMAAPKEMAGAASMLQNLNATADGKTTTLTLSVLEQQIEQFLRAAQASSPHVEHHAHLQAMPSGGASESDAARRIHVGSEAQHAKLIQQPAPVYPPLAKQAGVTGVVRLNAIIGADGTVKNLTVSSGHPILVPAAMEAAKQWVYQPTLLNGKPVEVITEIEINFTLAQ